MESIAEEKRQYPYDHDGWLTPHSFRMNTLSITKIQLNKIAYQWSIAVDDIPLYKYFEKCIDDDVSDSVALPIKDPHDLKDFTLLWGYDNFWKGNEDFVWFLTDSQEDEVVPLLSCPDCAEEMDCLLLCAFVRKAENVVHWDKIGRIIHEENRWEKMIQSGFTCKEVLSKADGIQYGADTPVAKVDDFWVSEHWREELLQRNKRYLRNYYKTPNGVKWLKEVNWTFSAQNYQEVVNFFRNTPSE